MTPRLCDRCGQPIPPDRLRYIAKIQVYAAYDPLEITFDDLTRDHRHEINTLLEQCEGVSEEELMRGVFVEFKYNLCAACQKAYLARPLPPAPLPGSN